jgi:hypothetical protein
MTKFFEDYASVNLLNHFGKIYIVEGHFFFEMKHTF